MRPIPAVWLFGLLLLISPPRANAESLEAAEIRAMLDAQVACWNRGDIEGYMNSYVKSEKLRFASDGSVTHGWQATLERYRKRYRDKSEMGMLTFTCHEIELVGPETAMVFGKWELQRAADHPWGLFTLIVKKTASGWRIASDHTSSAK